jgi:hypothetical protein
MLRGKTTPSPRPYKPSSNDAVFMVFLVGWPRKWVFWNINLCTEAKNDIDTKDWRGGAEKIAKKGGCRRHEAYTGGSGITISWHWWDHEWWRAKEQLSLYSWGWTTTRGEITIDYFAQPTSCNLILLVGGSFRMKVRRGLVYPRQTMLDDVKIDTSSYAVVKVDMVHDNSKDLRLDVPPDDTTLTKWDAVTWRVQWRWTSIDVDPSAAASTSTTPS